VFFRALAGTPAKHCYQPAILCGKKCRHNLFARHKMQMISHQKQIISQKNVKISQKHLTGTGCCEIFSASNQLGTEIMHIGCDSIQKKSAMKESVHVPQDKKLLAFTQNHVATR